MIRLGLRCVIFGGWDGDVAAEGSDFLAGEEGSEGRLVTQGCCHTTDACSEGDLPYLS